MENQIEIYDYLDSIMQEYKKQEWLRELKLDFFVSDVMKNLNINDETEITISINRTLDVCHNLKISVPQNFKKIYRSDGYNIHTDWKISSLACYLIIINCNPNNETVAKAQLHFVLNNIKN